jgi:hypothetical protein
MMSGDTFGFDLRDAWQDRWAYGWQQEQWNSPTNTAQVSKECSQRICVYVSKLWEEYDI